MTSPTPTEVREAMERLGIYLTDMAYVLVRASDVRTLIAYIEQLEAKPAPLPGEVLERFEASISAANILGTPHSAMLKMNFGLLCGVLAAVRALAEKNAELAAEVERLKPHVRCARHCADMRRSVGKCTCGAQAALRGKEG